MCCAVALSSLFSSCDKMSEHRFSTTLTQVFDVQMNESSLPYSIDLTKLTDVLQANADLASHSEDIKSFEVVKVYYKVWEYYDDPAATFNGYIGLGDKSSTNPGTTLNFTDFLLQSSMDNAETTKLILTTTDVAAINKYLLDTKGLTLYVKGQFSATPARFKLQVSVDVDAVAEFK